jgi:hypothetical protein
MKNEKLKIKNEGEDGKLGNGKSPMLAGGLAGPAQCGVRNAECGMNREGDRICQGGKAEFEDWRLKTDFSSNAVMAEGGISLTTDAHGCTQIGNKTEKQNFLTADKTGWARMGMEKETRQISFTGGNGGNGEVMWEKAVEAQTSLATDPHGLAKIGMGADRKDFLTADKAGLGWMEGGDGNTEYPTSIAEHGPRRQMSGRTLPARSMTMWSILKRGRDLGTRLEPRKSALHPAENAAFWKLLPDFHLFPLISTWFRSFDNKNNFWSANGPGVRAAGTRNSAKLA